MDFMLSALPIGLHLFCISKRGATLLVMHWSKIYFVLNYLKTKNKKSLITLIVLSDKNISGENYIF